MCQTSCIGSPFTMQNIATLVYFFLITPHTQHKSSFKARKIIITKFCHKSITLDLVTGNYKACYRMGVRGGGRSKFLKVDRFNYFKSLNMLKLSCTPSAHSVHRCTSLFIGLFPILVLPIIGRYSFFQS